MLSGKRVFKLIVLICALVLLGSAYAQAALWDFAKDFSTSTNPATGGAWTFGYQPIGGDSMTAYDAYWVRDGFCYQWYQSANGPDYEGNCVKNKLTGPAAYWGMYWETGMACEAPPLDPSSMTVVRWTAPSAMTINFYAKCTGQNTDGSTSAEIYIFKNGTDALYGGGVFGFSGRAVNGFSDRTGTSPVQVTGPTQISVAANDTIDVLMNNNGTSNFDYVGLTELIGNVADTGVVSGTVTANGTGIGGALVQTTDGAYSALTDTDGSYLFMVPAVATPGTSYDVQVVKTGLAANTTSITVIAGMTTTQNFTYNSGNVQGTVYADITDTPVIPGATVTAVEAGLSTTTNSTGGYSLTLPEGTYTLQAVTAGYVTGSQQITISANNTTPADFYLVRNSKVNWFVEPDFSATSNPNDCWSYGVVSSLDLGYAFTLSTNSLPGYYPGVGWMCGADGQPSVIHNSTAGVMTTTWGWNIPAHSLMLSPYPGNYPAPAIRWTSPDSTSIRVDATFTGRSTPPNLMSSGVHVMHNGTEIFPVDYAYGWINGYLDSVAYTDIIDVSYGDTIDFVTYGPADNAPGIGISASIMSSFGTVSGTVLCAGEPLSGVTVQTSDGSIKTVTDSDGTYTFVIPAGDQTVKAYRFGYGVQTATISLPQAGEMTQDFTLVKSSTSFDAEADFSTTSNPNDCWSYGTLSSVSSGAFTASSNALPGYYPGAGWMSGVDGLPSVIHNSTDSLITSGWGWQIPAHGLMISPLYGTYSLRWTAPETSRASISVSFVGARDPFSVESTGYVLHNGSSLFSDTITSYLDSASYTTEMDVAAGDTIDFAVGAPGGDGATGIDATVRLMSGTVSGIVTSSGVGLYGATVQTSSGSAKTTSDVDGNYSLTLGTGSQTLEVSCPGYIAQTATVTVPDGGTIPSDFELSRNSKTSWSAAGDFSTTDNPNDTWSYGYSDDLGYGYEFSLYEGALPTINYDSSHVLGWTVGEGWVNSSNVSYNITSSPYMSSWNQYWPAYGLTCDPIPANRTSIVRWISPVLSTLNVDATFTGRDLAGSKSNVQILVNGGSVYSATVEGYAGDATNPASGVSPLQTASLTIPVAQGDTVDFAVCVTDGSDPVQMRTGLDVTITTGSAPINVSELSDLKSAAIGTGIVITDPKVVTSASGTFTDAASCYIEEPDRASGIKMVLPVGLGAAAIGDNVTLMGSVALDSNGERCINVTNIEMTGGSALGALGMGNKAVSGVTGLLVRTWGKVTFKAADGSYITIDDGSSVGVTVILNGLTTAITKTINETDYVGITGLVGLDTAAGVVVRPRGDADIDLY
ncbi:MAG: carboxypeptidase-like regulatory domain-containing protein [Armatimonadota bacterium]|nr:carboxypeptidase-like regulatory domain-containing protein [bacterium]